MVESILVNREHCSPAKPWRGRAFIRKDVDSLQDVTAKTNANRHAGHLGLSTVNMLAVPN